MYEIPSNFDFSFMKDRVLLQLGIGQNEIILNFDNDIRILIEVPIKLKSPNEKVVICDAHGADCIGLPAVLGRHVTECKMINSKAIKILFEDGTLLELEDKKERYESFSIKQGENFLLVV